MSLLHPSLLQKLARTRLNTRQAIASTGFGERRSRGKGSGIEFADHRSYQLGDDIRHLDRHVYARLGQHVIKQFSLYQQLEVTILVDASASMAFGQPQKLRRAVELAGGLAYIGLTGGDRVRVGAFRGSRLSWYPPVLAVRRAPGLFSWLEQLQAQGETDFAGVVRASVPRLRSDGLLVVISDWMAEGAEDALRAWYTAGQELVGIHLLAPEEVEPERLGSGPLRMTDLENGQEVETTLDAEVFGRYRTHLDQWREKLRESLYRQGGRYFAARTDDELERTLLTEWRAKGLVS